MRTQEEIIEYIRDKIYYYEDFSGCGSDKESDNQLGRLQAFKEMKSFMDTGMSNSKVKVIFHKWHPSVDIPQEIKGSMFKLDEEMEVDKESFHGIIDWLLLFRYYIGLHWISHKEVMVMIDTKWFTQR